MIKIITGSSPQSFVVIGPRLARLLNQTLKLKKSIVVNVVFLSAAKAQALNRQLRRHRYVPDVLSLNFTTYRQLDKHSSLPFLGELYLCWPQIKKQAKANGKPAEQELAWVLLHGLLHLLGYDHEQAAAGKVMRTLEQKVLTRLISA